MVIIAEVVGSRTVVLVFAVISPEITAAVNGLSFSCGFIQLNS